MKARRRAATTGGLPVNPQWVTLARHARGLTQSQLASHAGLRQEIVSKIEAGVIPASEEDVAKLTRALDFPAQFFFQDARVNGPAVTEFLHRKRAKATTTALNRLHALAAVREMHVQVLLRSWGTDAEFPSYPIEEYDGSPKRIAQTVRAVWSVPPGPVFSVTQLAEEAGAIVLAFDFATRDIDGFSRYPNDAPPLIFLNSALPPDRWRWTVAHEVGHIVMHANSDPYPDMERDANAFASEFLMPAREISPQLTRVTIDRLAGLKRYWKVAMAALLMRADDLKLITANQKRYLFMQLSKAGYRLREPETLDPPREPPRLMQKVISHHRRILGYSTGELCSILALNESDFPSWYHADEPSIRLLN